MQSPTSTNESFFDDQKGNFDFQTPNKTHYNDLDSIILYSSPLTCLNPQSNSPKEGVFSLHNQLLVFTSGNREETATEVLQISNSHLKRLIPDQHCLKFGFQVTKNGVSIKFYALNHNVAETWFTLLKRVCTLSSFHDDYSATKVIGKGGFAMVYLVESIQNKVSYAVKAFSKAELIATNKKKAKPALINEVDMMRRVNHDNFVQLYEVHESDNSIYLVMELIKGKTLHDTLKRSMFKKKLSKSRIQHFIQSILISLDYLESVGILHRDLKPANILVEKGDKIKITDFGLATLMDAPNYIFKKCGTPGYMAPEIFRYGEKTPTFEYSTRCDMFSVGCVFFEMLFGRPLFDIKDFDEIIRQNRWFTNEHEAVALVKRELMSTASKVNKEALDLLLQMIEFNPNKRVTAAQALEHSYFLNALKLEKNASNDGGALMSPTTSNSRFGFSFKDLSSCSGSFIFPGQGKFAEKDSLYLDVGKSESLKKTDDTMGSFHNNLHNNASSTKDENSLKLKPHANSFSALQKLSLRKGSDINGKPRDNRFKFGRTSVFRKAGSGIHKYEDDIEFEKLSNNNDLVSQEQNQSFQEQDPSENVYTETSDLVVGEDAQIEIKYIGFFAQELHPSKNAKLTARDFY